MAQESPTIVGRKPDTTMKRPKTAAEARICDEKGCETKLSRYNTNEKCYRHRPTRFPRVRGRPK